MTTDKTASGTTPARTIATPSREKTSFTASGRLTAWRGIDLITAAMIAVAFGVIFWGFDTFVYPVVGLASAGFPPLGELALGVWLLPAVVGALVIRRPGAALLTELIAANVEMLLGNQWGIAVLASGALQGLGVEIVFGLLLWRRFGLPVAMAGGVLSAVLEIVVYEWWAYVPGFSWTWRFVYLASGMVSGAVIAGIGGWLLVRALARSGALNAFPAGAEVREARVGK
ncbi:ECF transporter S component [Subtercola frigoramans]|uniref:Energy-coupling factor transport system substrate-specific component n=1 Tax=Subtercola frigoramans TaxID=120298 RepID=A0ABS2L3W3_9MICO|nr:ECF transporter S component [Subtercola frigoramans]MBM7471790.1 energy-coupling factor transport system substrate-specific component [Subtercola frigoramans]